MFYLLIQIALIHAAYSIRRQYLTMYCRRYDILSRQKAYYGALFSDEAIAEWSVPKSDLVAHYHPTEGWYVVHC